MFLFKIIPSSHSLKCTLFHTEVLIKDHLTLCQQVHCRMEAFLVLAQVPSTSNFPFLLLPFQVDMHKFPNNFNKRLVYLHSMLRSHNLSASQEALMLLSFNLPDRPLTTILIFRQVKVEVVLLGSIPSRRYLCKHPVSTNLSNRVSRRDQG
jgi:hypothetical protein